MQSSPDGRTIIADLKLWDAYQRGDGTPLGGKLQRQIFEKALSALEERVWRGASS